MEFVFEERKHSGKGSEVGVPKFPAVKITVHRCTKDKDRNTLRLYAVFSPEAVKEARWIKGDRLVVGADVKSKLICFKRDQERGFSLCGACFEKGRGNANLQVSTTIDSPLWSLTENHVGKWIPISSQGIMLIAKME
jgi:hypothetical protein